MQLNKEQIDAMSEIEKFINQSINFEIKKSSRQLLTFDSYIENKTYQNDIIGQCVKRKICKK